MRLRQIALVARDLEPVVDDLCAVLGIEVCFNDPAVGVFGLKNAVMPIGDTFLEVVCPVQKDATAARYLERRGGDGGYMVIVQSEDLEGDRKRFAELEIRTAWSIDLDDASSSHLHPKDTGGAILSIDAMRPPLSWRWAGPNWSSKMHSAVTREIAGVELQSPEPNTLAHRWASILNRQDRVTAGGERGIPLERGFIRFVRAQDGRGEGVSAVIVKAADRGRLFATARERGLPVGDNHVQIGGTRFELA